MLDTPKKQITGPVVRLHSEDNVVVARVPIQAGVEVVDGIITTCSVTPGYKIATQRITKGDAIRKYNVIIGYADSDIEIGTMLENHNVMFHEGKKITALAVIMSPSKCSQKLSVQLLKGICARMAGLERVISSPLCPPSTAPQL